MARRNLPTGTVSFLFTDIEGSTKLLDALGPAAYADALAAHRRVLRDAFAAHHGVEVDTQGDAFFVAFPEAREALAAADGAVAGLSESPVRIRVGIHTGTPHVTDEGYVGRDVHQAARISAVGHGGQVLLSGATRATVDGDLLDLGEHRLKDFAEPVRIFQLGSERFPPLRTISNTNLPRPASSFVGRDREVRRVTELLRDGARLLTLTGPGGSGKTRLAIEAATELVPDFEAGVFWVELSPLRDPRLVPEAIAQSLGAKEGLASHIGEREMLLLLDNLEQVIAAAPKLADLVETCPNLRLLTTSRERLRVRGEVEYAVPPLAEPEAVELFCARAGVDADASIAELCRRLDNLPLAVELASARASVLTPVQILERLSGRLDLLKGGRDADARQATLRATIEWSHELLAQAEQRLFARLSVFAGGWTLEASEAVAEADVDTLQALVDKSLVRHADGRFSMLETIRDYATERLEASAEADEIRRRHASYYRALALAQDAALRAGEPEEGPVGVLATEIYNLRAVVELALRSAHPQLVREITVALTDYWMVRGLYGEGRAWIDRALEVDAVEDDTRRRLLSALGIIAYGQGDRRTAVAAADEAAALAAKLGGATERLALLREQAFAAARRDDLKEAERLFRERLAVAIAVDNGVTTSSCRLNLASIANKTRRHDVAEAWLAENLPFVRARGQVRCEANTLAYAADTALQRGDPDGAVEPARRAAELSFDIADVPTLVWSLDLYAAGIAARGQHDRAVSILDATQSTRETMGMETDPDEEAVRTRAVELIGGASAVDQARAAAQHVDLEGALRLAVAT